MYCHWQGLGGDAPSERGQNRISWDDECELRQTRRKKDLEIAIRVQEKVRRLEITMKNIGRVESFEGSKRLG